MHTLWEDFRYGNRMLLKSPASTSLVILTLALGIGTSTAIFSVANAVLLRPLPYADPQRLVIFSANHEAKSTETNPVSYQDAQDWKAQSPAIADIGLLGSWNFNLTGVDTPERLPGALATPNLFTLLNGQPMLGRLFRPEETQPGKDNVVILSHGFWQRRFGSDAAIVGRTLTLNGASMTVVGVMPPNFGYPYDEMQLWAPLAGVDQKRSSRWLIALGRLNPGVAVKEAQAELDTVSRRLEQSYPESNTGWGVKVRSLHEELVHDVRPALFILLGAVGMLLMIACVNAANLTLARGTSRRKEIAIRAALGATRGRIIWQPFAESLTLAMLGGILGVLLAYWLSTSLIAFAPETIPRLSEVRLDGKVLSFALGVTIWTAMLFGLAPALRTSKFNLTETLKEEGGTTSGSRRNRMRGLLVVSEIALSLMLLIGAGLLLNSFIRLRRTHIGFNPENLLTMQLMLVGPKYNSIPKQQAFLRQAIEKIESLPGVANAGAITNLPVGGTSGRVHYSFAVEGQQVQAGQEPEAYYRSVSPSYFQTMSIPLLAGRQLTDADNETSLPVAIINQAMARQMWPGQDPLGKRVRWGAVPGSPEPPWMTVVGVLGDVKQSSLHTEEQIAIYVPYSQKYTWMRWLSLVVRTTSDPQGFARSVSDQIHEIDREQPVYYVHSMEKILSDSLIEKRFNVLLLDTLALASLLLVAVGIYGVISYSVVQRTQEMGVRVALGAQRHDIIKLVIRQGLPLILTGLAIGLGCSVALTRLMSTMLFGISPIDPLTFVGVSVLLIVVTVLACYIPARRATKVDPLVALRYE